MSKRTQGSRTVQDTQKKGKALIWIMTALVMVCAMGIPILLSANPPGATRSDTDRYTVGELANEDVFATSSFQYLDTEKTRQLREQEYANILPNFSFSLQGTTVSMQRVNTFRQIWEEEEDPVPKLVLFLAESKLTDQSNVLGRFSAMDPELRNRMLEALSAGMETILKQGLLPSETILRLTDQGYSHYSVTNTLSMEKVEEMDKIPFSEAVTKEKIPDFLHAWVSPYIQLYPGFQPELLFDTLELLAQENVVYDEASTLLLREEAEKRISPVYVSVKRGQKIISRDTVITEEQLALLDKMNDSYLKYSWMELFGRSIFVLLITLGSLYVFMLFLKNDIRLLLYTNLMLFSVLVSEVALFFLLRYVSASQILMRDSFLPILFGPVFVAHITSKKRLGLVTSFMLSAYAMLLPQSSPMVFFFGMTAAGSCLYSFRFSGNRIDEIFNWFYACIASSFLALCLNLLSGFTFAGILPFLGALVLNITLSILAVDIMVPVCERLFNIPTAYRLSELASSDSPVLDRLGAVAQGTYNHSRYVSELASNAAKAIGADSMLARVGGMYHDIGKTDHPEYFIENQGMENKHDEIKPSLSVAIIKSHVKVGIEKGREAGLPQEVLDIIAQHHGDDVIVYFYNEAKEAAAKSGREVKIEDYSYNGTPPTSPEAAIVMLSDCVEAASRTIKKPNPAKYEKLIHSVVMGKIERNQLGKSRLSLTDLDLISSSFLQTLIGRDHHRIEYPEEPQPEDQTQIRYVPKAPPAPAE
jgi:putative nucleotidyltransferase with HDIG domain